MNQGASSQGVSLHDLIALNDEIVAMVRAGVPLDQGLLQLSGDLPRRLGELASQLGQRLQGGQELTRILADDTLAFPPVWKVMVATGVRTGHLTEVLECLAAAGRRAAEMRRTIALAFVYPTLVWILAYATLVLLTTCLAPILDGALRDLTSHAEPLARCLAWLGEHLVWWVAAPPALFCLVAFWEWSSSRSGRPPGGGPVSRVLSWCFPGMVRAWRDLRLAAFTEILAWLTRAKLPLPEALQLAGDACGDARLRQEAIQLAGLSAQGELSPTRDNATPQIPPLLAWMLSAGARGGELSDALLWTAERYRERSQEAANRFAAALPIALTLSLGGGAVAIVGVSVFWPIWQLLWRLGEAT